MKTEPKTFDCVEMKDRVQRELREEYERRKGEFSSYEDFINRTAEECEAIRVFSAKLRRTWNAPHIHAG